MEKYAEQCKAIKELADTIALDCQGIAWDGDETQQLAEVFQFFLDVQNGNLDDAERKAEAKRLGIEFLDQ